MRNAAITGTAVWPAQPLEVTAIPFRHRFFQLSGRAGGMPQTTAEASDSPLRQRCDSNGDPGAAIQMIMIGPAFSRSYSYARRMGCCCNGVMAASNRLGLPGALTPSSTLSMQWDFAHWDQRLGLTPINDYETYTSGRSFDPPVVAFGPCAATVMLPERGEVRQSLMNTGARGLTDNAKQVYAIGEQRAC